MFTKMVAATRSNLSTAADGRWLLSPLTLTMFDQLKLGNCSTPDGQRRRQKSIATAGVSPPISFVLMERFTFPQWANRVPALILGLLTFGKREYISVANGRGLRDMVRPVPSTSGIRRNSRLNSVTSCTPAR
jgi:hypothetical protein